MMITMGARERVHPDLTRHPFIDVSRAPDERAEDELYAGWRFINSFDASRGRVRSIPSLTEYDTAREPYGGNW